MSHGLRFVHVAACLRCFFSPEYIPFYGYTIFCLSIRVDEHLDDFQLLAIMSNGIMNIYIEFCEHVFSFLLGNKIWVT